MNSFWSQVFLGNTLRNWGIAIGIIVATLIGLRIAKQIVLSRLKKWSQRTDTKFDDFLIALINRFGVPFLYIFGIYLGIKSLQLSSRASRITDIVILFTATYFTVRIIVSALSYIINTYAAGRNNEGARLKQARGIIVLANIVVWIIAFLFLIDNLGYNITTIITGLGIGGIAIALATQTILGDLFSYFVIFFDKPFEIGDFIIIGDKMGSVEYIGIKTTRLRSLGGEQLVFSNTDLTNSRVHNYKRMEKRRVVFSLGITYETPADKIEKISGIIKKIIESQADTVFDRAHFLSFGDFSLKIEVVYYVLSADYNLYMDRQQSINLAIVKAFEEMAIDFAYPTQNVILSNLGQAKEAWNGTSITTNS